MSYSSDDDIVNEFKKLDIVSVDSVINAAKLAEFRDQAEAEINTYLANRYVLPISGSASLLFLKKIEIDLVAFRIVKIISVRKAVSGSNEAMQQILEGLFYKEAMDKLKMLAKGQLKLSDAPTLTGNLVKSYNQANNICPTIKKGERQW